HTRAGSESRDPNSVAAFGARGRRWRRGLAFPSDDETARAARSDSRDFQQLHGRSAGELDRTHAAGFYSFERRRRIAFEPAGKGRARRHHGDAGQTGDGDAKDLSYLSLAGNPDLSASAQSR